MKTIEQKAKAYDEAIEAARCIYNNMKDGGDFGGMEDLEVIFPELKESDDERIRKEIVETLNYANEVGGILNDVKCREYIAWLEKQCEQKPYGQREECSDCQFNYAGECKGSCAMKRGEQKTADTVELKFKVGDTIRLKNSNSEYTIENISDSHYYGKGFLISIFGGNRDYELVEQKPAWSDEDEEIIQGIWDEILANKHNAKEYEWKTYDKFLDWLKSLKDRVQPQNSNVTDKELAHAKKDAYNHALDKIEYHSGEPTFDDGWSA